MSKSDIVFQLQYKTSKNKKIGICKWIGYATQKQKADSFSIDETNILKDYVLYSDKNSFLSEEVETFLWNSQGDVLKKDVINGVKDMNSNGIFWRGFLSFPPEFAIEHGLITKTDYYSLTNQVMPQLIIDMGLDLNNTEWMCTLHRDTQHPHIHLCVYEKNPTKTTPQYPKSVIYKFKSNVANYLIDNKKFYELRDQAFNNIVKTIDLKEYNKIKSQQLFSDKYRKELNKMLLNFYNELPKTGRLQYNSKNIIPYKKELDKLIEYVLMHDSIKYEYAKYLRLLEEHQKELNQIYGQSKSNHKMKYYNDQINRLYTKIGNEILSNFKKYQSMELMERETIFLKKHINELNFKSRKDYAKEETKIQIAKQLYKVCILANVSNSQMKKIFKKWISNSGYDFDAEALILSVSSSNNDLSINELYDALKKLGYDLERYNKFKNKNFYRELEYKKIMNSAINHLMYELEQEEKQIIENLQYELEEGYYK